MPSSTRGEDATPLSFFESIENLQNLKSFRNSQTFTGHLKLEDFGNDFKGSFRVKLVQDVINKDAFENDARVSIKGSLTFEATGEDIPFTKLIAGFSGDVISLVKNGIYFRLNNVSISAKGVPEDELESYSEFQDEQKANLNLYKDKWFFIPFDHELISTYGNEVDHEEVLKNLRENGFKEAYEELIQSLAGSFGGTDSEESEKITEVLSDFFNTQFFTARKVVAGRYKGNTSFSLSKRRLLSFLKKAGVTMKEPLTPGDLEEIDDFLSKFYINGVFHINNVRNIYDLFVFKLTLRNIEGLKFGKFILQNKITHVNQIKAIEAPADSISIDEFPLEQF